MATVSSVFITGASAGIGEACALRLDREGWRVFAGVRRTQDGEALRAKASERLVPVLVDVTDAGQIASAVEAISTTAGDAGLQALVNNAGIGVGGPLEFLPLDEFRMQFEVNVFGVMSVTQACMPLIRKGKGRIVMIGSVSGRLPTPFAGPYAASKFAIEALSDALRGELRPWGLHVILIEPGGVRTPIWEKSRKMSARLKERMPKEAFDLYGPVIGKIDQVINMSERMGVPPDRVARIVSKALAARRPKTRYLVARFARTQAFIGDYVPDRLRDWILERLLVL